MVLLDSSAHGGNIYQVSRNYGIKVKDLVDFSASINPLGLSQQLRKLLVESIDDMVNYPDTECSALRDELSRYLNVSEDSIAAGNGAIEVICLVFKALRPKKLFMPAPCFSEYEGAAKEVDTGVIYHRLYEEEEFKLDIERFIREIPADADTILICNPNNPTSKLISKNNLHTLINHAFTKNIRIIIDEAFIELTAGGNDNSAVCWLERYPNLFVIRSLTKILAVPGLRLGYVLGEPSVISRIRRDKLKWSVNSLACSIGRVLNEDKAYFEKTAQWLAAEKKRLYNGLAGIGKLRVFKPDSNFILMRILDERFTSASLRERLIAKCLIIRDASNFKYLDDRFVRVAVRDREANDRLLSALAETLL
jgi:threonine-phosphate decarboxylase